LLCFYTQKFNINYNIWGYDTFEDGFLINEFSLFDKKVNLSFYKGSEYYYNNCLSLPIFYNLKINVQKKIINKIISYLK
jgi:hypothetical protein